MIKRLKKSFYIGKDNSKEFYQTFHSENAKRLLPFLFAIIIYLSYILLNTLRNDIENPDFIGTIVIKIVLILFCSASMFMLWYFKNTSNIRLLSTLVYSTATICNLLGATNAFLIQNIIPSITIFIISIMITAAVIRMSIKGILFVYSIAYIYFMVGYPYFQLNEDYARWGSINGSIAIITGVILTLILLKQSISHFRDRKEIEDKNEQLQFLANHDAMTGLLNHQCIQKHIDEIKEEALKENQSVCLAVVDVDNLKLVNDTYGHLNGDKMILSVVNILNEISRETDVIGRYGGDEFVVILPDIDIDGAYEQMSKIKKTVAGIYIKDIHVTVSIGISKLVESNIDTLIEEADKRMYESKRNGKNQVTI